jgi:IclR family acetate operon transcriptional repressor
MINAWFSIGTPLNYPEPQPTRLSRATWRVLVLKYAILNNVHVKTQKEPEIATRYLIPVVRSTFKIITELAQGDPLSLNDAAQRTGIPKSTAFRVLATLQYLGVVVRDRDEKKYRLGRMLTELARETSMMETLRRIALPHMLQLRDAFGETVNLGELQHDKVVYVEVVPSEYALRLSERPGATVWALSTSLGRCILAFSPQERVASLIGTRKLPALTQFTITQPKKLKQELEKIRERGYAIECEESALQATCVGVPILDRKGIAVAALSISGPTHRFLPAHDKKVLTALIDSARAIEREFHA